METKRFRFIQLQYEEAKLKIEAISRKGKSGKMKVIREPLDEDMDACEADNCCNGCVSGSYNNIQKIWELNMENDDDWNQEYNSLNV